MTEPDLPTYHVLALSGGGYRALYSATVLAQLEETLGAPLAKRFDLICGTSAGGMLAIGLAAEIPAAELQALFEQDVERRSQELLEALITNALQAAGVAHTVQRAGTMLSTGYSPAKGEDKNSKKYRAPDCQA